MLIAADAARAIKTVNVSVKCFQVLCKSNEDVDDDDVVEASRQIIILARKLHLCGL